MGYSLTIEEQVSRSLSAMDEIRHDLFVVTMLDLVKDPHGRGEELRRTDTVVERILTLGSFGTILYAVDNDHNKVIVIDVLWPGSPTQRP